MWARLCPSGRYALWAGMQTYSKASAFARRLRHRSEDVDLYKLPHCAFGASGVFALRASGRKWCLLSNYLRLTNLLLLTYCN